MYIHSNPHFGVRTLPKSYPSKVLEDSWNKYPPELRDKAQQEEQERLERRQLLERENRKPSVLLNRFVKQPFIDALSRLVVTNHLDDPKINNFQKWRSEKAAAILDKHGITVDDDQQSDNRLKHRIPDIISHD